MPKKRIPLFAFVLLAAGLSASLSIRSAFATFYLDGSSGHLTSTCATLNFTATPSAIPKGVPTPVRFSWTQRNPGLFDGGEVITNLQTGAVVYSNASYVNPVTVTVTISATTVFELNSLYGTSSGCETTPIDVVVAATNPVCGNGIVETGETCDNGASNGTCPATCSTSCTPNACTAASFDQGSGMISAQSTQQGTYSIPIIVTGKDSATGIITSTSGLTMNVTVGPSSGSVGTINVSSTNSAVPGQPVNASWLFSTPPGGACQGPTPCTGTQATYTNQPTGSYIIMPQTAAGYAFRSVERQAIAVRPDSMSGGIFSNVKNFLVSVARAFSFPVSNPPNQTLTATGPTNILNFTILWDPIAQLGVSPAAVPVSDTSPNGTIAVSNPGSPGSTLNWSASAPSYAGGPPGWLSLPSSGSVNAGSSQNITVTANTGGIPPGACRAASPCTATVTFTGSSSGCAPSLCATPGGATFVTVTITLTMSGGPVAISITPAPPTVVAVGVPAQVRCTGGSGSYTWSSTGPSTFSSNTSVSGQTINVSFSSPSSPTYRVTCTEIGGSGLSASTAITVTPPCTISASPTAVVPPQPSTLTWGCSTGTAISCTVNGSATVSGTPVGTSGSASVSPTQNSTYLLSCIANNGLNTIMSSQTMVTVQGPGVIETNP